MCIPYDDASRIPLIIRYPKLFPAGRVWKSGVSLVDLMPTILDVAGVWPLDRAEIHGRSLAADMKAGRDEWNRTIMMQNLPMAAIDGSFYDERALRTENRKLIAEVRQPAGVQARRLYDMRDDQRRRTSRLASLNGGCETGHSDEELGRAARR
jgi:arylsulfatase A-like enzyme